MEEVTDESADEHVSKKVKLVTPSSITLRSDLLDRDHVEALRKKYPTAPGYPHCIVQNVLDANFFREVREEIINTLSANFKETDLFKLYQTGDLANMDPTDPQIAARLPKLLALREAIYSASFRRFVSEITGCEELTDRTDCSSNLYAQGCHLLCHDDVIGTRCVSFIIYLTDPDEAWEEEDGGSLEIFPLSKPDALGSPAVRPITSHLPLPNTMAFFTVLPGRSFHAVEEVYPEGKMRLSISGWYHAATPPKGSDLASLSQLQTRETSSLTKCPSPADVAEDVTTEQADWPSRDRLLTKWINPAYLSSSSMKQISERFQEEKSILLYDFLDSAIAEDLRRQLQRKDEGLGGARKADYEAGYGEGWSAVGPPHKQRYLRYHQEEEKEKQQQCCPCGNLLLKIQKELLQSPSFLSYLQHLTGLTLSGYSSEIRRFRPGLDYTVAHYGILTKEERLDASLCFVDDEGEEKQELWSSGDVGGFGCYIKADEGNDGAEAAESYVRPSTARSEEASDDVLNIFATQNALSLVLREKNAMRFVKYVSASAPGSRWDISSEYVPHYS